MVRWRAEEAGETRILLQSLSVRVKRGKRSVRSVISRQSAYKRADVRRDAAVERRIELEAGEAVSLCARKRGISNQEVSWKWETATRNEGVFGRQQRAKRPRRRRHVVILIPNLIEPLRITAEARARGDGASCDSITMCCFPRREVQDEGPQPEPQSRAVKRDSKVRRPRMKS